MAGLKVFVSSTCYDLSEERTQVRNLLINLGHDPILSDHNDIHYGSNEHTHVSCIRQVSNADMVILLVGSRYGGVAIEDALNEVNLELIQEKLNNKIQIKELISEMQSRTKSSAEAHEKDPDFKKLKYGFSITHFEILRAIQEDIPIYAFVKDKVWNFNELYTVNKEMIEKINIPSIDQNHSKYLFEFIEILKNRKLGNSIFPYSNYLDIETTLKKQLAEKLKTLMEEQKNIKKEWDFQKAHIDHLTARFDDLKSVILSTVKGNEKEIAKGVLKYKRVLSILFNMFYKANKTKAQVIEIINNSNINFNDFIKTNLNIKEVKPSNYDSNSETYEIMSHFAPNRSTNFKSKRFYNDLFLISDEFFYYFGSESLFEKISIEWSEFINLASDIKEPVINALIDEDIGPFPAFIKYFNENFDIYIQHVKEQRNTGIHDMEARHISWGKFIHQLNDDTDESYALGA